MCRKKDIPHTQTEAKKKIIDKKVPENKQGVKNVWS
jgi:hypothetical protein